MRTRPRPFPYRPVSEPWAPPCAASVPRPCRRPRSTHRAGGQGARCSIAEPTIPSGGGTTRAYVRGAGALLQPCSPVPPRVRRDGTHPLPCRRGSDPDPHFTPLLFRAYARAMGPWKHLQRSPPAPSPRPIGGTYLIPWPFGGPRPRATTHRSAPGTARRAAPGVIFLSSGLRPPPPANAQRPPPPGTVSAVMEGGDSSLALPAERGPPSGGSPFSGPGKRGRRVAVHEAASGRGIRSVARTSSGLGSRTGLPLDPAGPAEGCFARALPEVLPARPPAPLPKKKSAPKPGAPAPDSPNARNCFCRELLSEGRSPRGHCSAAPGKDLERNRPQRTNLVDAGHRLRGALRGGGAAGRGPRAGPSFHLRPCGACPGPLPARPLRRGKRPRAPRVGAGPPGKGGGRAFGPRARPGLSLHRGGPGIVVRPEGRADFNYHPPRHHESPGPAPHANRDRR